MPITLNLPNPVPSLPLLNHPARTRRRSEGHVAEGGVEVNDSLLKGYDPARVRAIETARAGREVKAAHREEVVKR